MADLNVNIRIPVEFKEYLEQVAREQDRTVSSVVRRLLAAYIKECEEKKGEVK